MKCSAVAGFGCSVTADIKAIDFLYAADEADPLGHLATDVADAQPQRRKEGAIGRIGNQLDRVVGILGQCLE